MIDDLAAYLETLPYNKKHWSCLVSLAALEDKKDVKRTSANLKCPHCEEIGIKVFPQVACHATSQTEKGSVFFDILPGHCQTSRHRQTHCHPENAKLSSGNHCGNCGDMSNEV